MIPFLMWENVSRILHGVEQNVRGASLEGRSLFLRSRRPVEMGSDPQVVSVSSFLVGRHLCATG